MPTTDFSVKDLYAYINGFGNYKESEVIAGAIPIAANSPQKCPYGLYNEKLSGTAFTVPRSDSQQTWLYRILPSASHQSFEAVTDQSNPSFSQSSPRFNIIPNQLLWDPFDFDENSSWINSLHLLVGAGDPTLKQGLGYYVYAVGKSMDPKTAFYSADGDFLIVPQHGTLDIRTELGRILVRPSEICVIPRGIRYHVALSEDATPAARGYVLELYQGHFQLPELGAIGSAGMANSRDFQTPVADFIDDHESEWTLYGKFGGRLFSATQSHTPFDVVGWHGTYYPYKYDLGRFCPLNAVLYDHIDPSIFTVLTAPSIPHGPGTAVVDFVAFGPRWNVSENTFRPPWYHRNTMSEFMGLIKGTYPMEFQAGGANLHNTMSGHGVDTATFEKASNAELKPIKTMDGTLSFMFESCLMVGVTDWGLKTVANKVHKEYNKDNWTPLKVHFKRPKLENGIHSNGDSINGHDQVA